MVELLGASISPHLAPGGALCNAGGGSVGGTYSEIVLTNLTEVNVPMRRTYSKYYTKVHRLSGSTPGFIAVGDDVMMSQEEPFLIPLITWLCDPEA